METLADVLFASFREVAPDVIGRKLSRKLMRAMLDNVAEKIPPNGCGPVIGMRREAAAFLSSAMRVIDEERRRE